MEEELARIRIAQRKGIEIAKEQGKFKGGRKKYHAGSTRKDKVIYDRIVQLIKSGMSVMDIHRGVDVARNTIFSIKKKLFNFNQRAFLLYLNRGIGRAFYFFNIFKTDF